MHILELFTRLRKHFSYTFACHVFFLQINYLNHILQLVINFIPSSSARYVKHQDKNCWKFVFLKQITSVLLIAGMQFCTGEVNNAQKLASNTRRLLLNSMQEKDIMDPSHSQPQTEEHSACDTIHAEGLSSKHDSGIALNAQVQSFLQKAKSMQGWRISTADVEKTNFTRNFSESLCFRNHRPLKFIPVTSTITTSISVSKYY